MAVKATGLLPATVAVTWAPLESNTDVLLVIVDLCAINLKPLGAVIPSDKVKTLPVIAIILLALFHCDKGVGKAEGLIVSKGDIKSPIFKPVTVSTVILVVKPTAATVNLIFILSITTTGSHGAYLATDIWSSLV